MRTDGDQPVSATERIGHELQATADGLDRAQQVAAAADNAAERIIAQAMASGFTGIARPMTQVRDQISQIRARLSAAASTQAQARASVAAVPEQASPQETIAVLTPVLSALAATRGALHGAMAAVAQTRQQTLAALQGGQPGPMLALLTQIGDILTALAGRGDTARQKVEAALARARQVGELGNG